MFLRGDSPIAGMPPAANCWWTERLAAAAARTPAWIEPLRIGWEAPSAMPDESIAWLAAAEMVHGWPKRFREFLDVYQEVSKYRTTSTGISRRFGLLIREAWQMEKLGYSTPANVLREYLLESYSGGHLSAKVCLFQGDAGKQYLAESRWITQTEATRMLGIRHRAIADLVRRGALIGRVHAAGSHGRSVGVISRESAEMLHEALKTTFPVAEVADRLGIGRHAVLDLIHAGALARAVRSLGGWKVPASSVQCVEDLLSRLPPVERCDSRWLSLRQATRVFGPAGLSLAATLQLVDKGKVEARRATDGKGLNRLTLWLPDLERCRPEFQAEFDRSRGYPLHRVGKVLFAERPVKVDVVKKWIDMRLLKAQRVGRARIVTAEELKRFQTTYCLAEDVCHILDISRATLSRWEVQGRIRPIYGKRVTPGAGFSLYRREDVDHLMPPESDYPVPDVRAA
jgi:plasmid maintenance system antidote protein VapI